MRVNQALPVGSGIWSPVHDDSVRLRLSATSFGVGNEGTADISVFTENEHCNFWYTVSGHFRTGEIVSGMSMVYGIDDGTVRHCFGRDECDCGGGGVGFGACPDFLSRVLADVKM